jgi:cytoskeletal protein RodZ
MRTRSTSWRLGTTLLLAGVVLLLSGVGVAAILAAPAAITGPVSAVGPTSATASGTVNPNGRSTSWFFEYGTTTSYGKRTSSRSAGSGSANIQISGPLTGLVPGTTYHYRLVATNGDGTVRGADGIFTTPLAPAAVTGSATSITVSSATLNGTVDPNGRATSWYFEYGTSTSYGSKTPTTTAGSGAAGRSVAAVVSSLARGRLYHFRLVATSDAGTSRGLDRTFSTAGPPTVVTGAASSPTQSSARLNGNVTANGLATTWYFEYGTSARYGAKTRARSAGKGVRPVNVSITVTRLRAATTYHYRLVATNSAGTRRGADATFTTAGVTLAAQAQKVVYGRAVMLSGRVPSGKAGESVALFAEVFGRGSPRQVATLVTGAGGVWHHLARPPLLTSYLSSWSGLTSRRVTIGVRPRVRFRRIGTARFVTRAVGARSFRGRLVKLQRRTAAGRWVTVKRVRLKRGSAATFRVRLRRGRSTLRIVMSVNQAGPGYLAGISRTIVYRR